MLLQSLALLLICCRLACAGQITFNLETESFESTDRPTYAVDGRLLQTGKVRFVHHDDLLQQTLNGEYTRNLTDALNRDGAGSSSSLSARPLYHTGRLARVEIISPREFLLLQSVGITMVDVDAIAYNNYIVYTIFKVLCMGRTEAVNARGELEEVEWLRVSSRNWEYMRRDVERLWRSKGGEEKGGFVATDYWPHITFATSNADGESRVLDEMVGREDCFADTTTGSPFPLYIVEWTGLEEEDALNSLRL